MKIAPIGLVLAFALAAPEVRSGVVGGSVTGRVVVMNGDKQAKRDEVWVYLEQIRPRRRRARGVAPPPREIRQEKVQFSPHVLVVPVGTVVTFPNYDHEEHNVFSPSDPPGQFDLGRYTTDHKGKSHQFDDPYEMEIYCDIHKEMWARVKVVDADASLIAKVDADDGQFAISGVPPGSYRLHAWTYDSEDVGEDIEIVAGATADSHPLHLQLGKVKTHLRKDGSRYPLYPK